MMAEYLNHLVEVPFEYRHCCWFCGEPAAQLFTFPHQQYLVIDCCHATVTLPACQECQLFAYQVQAESIWQVARQVKKLLIKKYRTHLAIGLNWTQAELANSEFEGGNFEGFKRSAWFMYEVAKMRVNFKGWPLVLSGLYIEAVDEKEAFIFDGVSYPSVDEAIEQYTKNFDLPRGYLKQTLHSLGVEQFSRAVRFCRLMVGTTPAERKQALRELVFTDEVIRSFNQT